MAVSDDIVAARCYGMVRCGESSLSAPTVEELATEFGLFFDASCYRDIDEVSARMSIQNILHRDMAYGDEVMAEQQAKQSTDRFFAQFGNGVRFCTNNWCPATNATFDEGVLVIGSQRSGCLWVEE